VGCVTRLQVLRGTSLERVSFTPLSGELVFDTTLNLMFVGDGMTAGGLPFSGESPVVIEILTTDSSLSGIDYAIFDSSIEIDGTLPNATTYPKPIHVNNKGDGLLNILTTGGQLIYGPLGGPVDNIQLIKTNAVKLVPKSGAWYLW
jgi:hypothetical protein